MKRWRSHLIILLIAGTGSMSCAQDYPSKPIRLVIPFAPGASNDIIGRLACQKLTEALNQQVTIDNRGGGGGTIGVGMVVKAAPDGYTLVLGNTGTLAVNPTLYASLSYDPVKDLQPITLINKAPTVLVVHPSVPVKSVRDLIALAKAHPDTITYGSGGSGSGAHLATELFNVLAKIKLLHVPYKGSGPALVDVLGGQITMMFSGPAVLAPLVKAGRLRALGVSSLNRMPTFPGVPAMQEAGVPGYEATLWYGILAPAGTPQAIVNKLNAPLVRALQTPELKERLAAEGSEAIGNTPEEFMAFIKSEIVRWAPVIKASGARPE